MFMLINFKNIKNTLNRYFIPITFSIFILVGFTLILHHEMWRDEIQTWLVSRDSYSISNLYLQRKYDGHPMLWYLCVMPFTKISRDPVVMQFVHFCLASTSIFLFLKFSPFSKIQKFFYTFGYYPLYEYAIISRNYVLSFLLITLFCIVYTKRFKHFLLLSLILALLANTNVLALIITMAISIALLADYFIFSNKKDNYQNLAFGLFIIFLGISIGIWSILPPNNSGFATEWNWSFSLYHIGEVFQSIIKAFFPVPNIELHFWKSHMLWNPEHIIISYIFALFLLSYCLNLIYKMTVTLKQNIDIFLMFVLSMTGLLSFFYIKYVGGMRHYGFLYITFIMSYWLFISKNKPNQTQSSDVNFLHNKEMNRHFNVILFAGFLGGLIAACIDYKYPFSMAKQTANYIKSNNLTDTILIGNSSHATSPIVGYLDKDKIYYPSGKRYGSYVIMDNVKQATKEDVLKDASIIFNQNNKALLILNYPLNDGDIKKYHLNLLMDFNGAIVKDENYYLYTLKSDN